jgi:hypothetical protein
MRLLSNRHSVADFTCNVCRVKRPCGASFQVPVQAFVGAACEVEICLFCLDEARRIARFAIRKSGRPVLVPAKEAAK